MRLLTRGHQGMSTTARQDTSDGASGVVGGREEDNSALRGAWDRPDGWHAPEPELIPQASLHGGGNRPRRRDDSGLGGTDGRHSGSAQLLREVAEGLVVHARGRDEPVVLHDQGWRLGSLLSLQSVR